MVVGFSLILNLKVFVIYNFIYTSAEKSLYNTKGVYSEPLKSNPWQICTGFEKTFNDRKTSQTQKDI